MRRFAFTAALVTVVLGLAASTAVTEELIDGGSGQSDDSVGGGGGGGRESDSGTTFPPRKEAPAATYVQDGDGDAAKVDGLDGANSVYGSGGSENEDTGEGEGELTRV